MGQGHFLLILFRESVHRFCLEQEYPSLSHSFKLERETEGWKNQPFYPFLLPISTSLPSASFPVRFSFSLSFPLWNWGRLSAPSHQPHPCMRDLTMEVLWPRLVCLPYILGCRAWPRSGLTQGLLGTPSGKIKEQAPQDLTSHMSTSLLGWVLSGAPTTRWDLSMASLSCLDFPDFVWETNSS